MNQLLTPEQLAAMSPEARKKLRARVRRAGLRQQAGDGIQCLLCKKQIEENGVTDHGTTVVYEARSLITHIRVDHGITDGVLGYEVATGLAPGTGEVVSPQLKSEVFAPAGAKGAAALAEHRAQAEQPVPPTASKTRKRSTEE
jgi:hypothetical protein